MLKDKLAVSDTGRDGIILNFIDNLKYSLGQFLLHRIFYFHIDF